MEISAKEMWANPYEGQPWCVATDGGFKCLHCGVVERLQLPMRIESVVLRSQAFRLDHAHCQPQLVNPSPSPENPS